MSVLNKHMSGKPQWYKKVSSDSRLSYQAVGLLAFILSQTEGWTFSVQSLERGGNTEEVKASCQELVSAGYLTRQDRKDKPPITHVADVSYEPWAKRNAAKDFSSKPASPKPVTRNDLAIAAGTAETASEALELAVPVELAEYRTQRGDGPQAVAGRVMKEWVAAVGMDPNRVRLTQERVKVVEARMAEGYGERDLTEAVRGIAMSSWHMGDNPENKKWNDMTLALRSGTNVEKFCTLYAEGGDQKMDAVDRAIALMSGGGNG